jgi:UDP-N-acetyl-D-glucosamine dehydrogenase
LNKIAEALQDRIRSGAARVGTLGLGYVGLPLSVEFASAGLNVTGFDLARDKVDAVNRGESYVKDVSSERLQGLLREGRLHASSDFGELAGCDAVIICVPRRSARPRIPTSRWWSTPRSRSPRRCTRGNSWCSRAPRIPGRPRS